ncbi:MAG: E3 ubiquitin protein ligase [Asgard group archaeon]|nr:E3 ubiquitin protein ligase [Asgard group archaeon]
MGSIVASLVTYVLYNEKKKQQTGKKWEQPDNFEELREEIKIENDASKIEKSTEKKPMLPEPFEYQEEYRTEIDYCMICKLEIRDKQLISFCPFCKSYFHKEHLSEWLIKNSDCPVCGKPLKNE